MEVRLAIWYFVHRALGAGIPQFIETGYGLDDRDSIPGRGKEFFFFLQRLERLTLQSAPVVLSPGLNGRDVKLNIYLLIENASIA
jgi:hypothetical protein